MDGVGWKACVLKKILGCLWYLCCDIQCFFLLLTGARDTTFIMGMEMKMVLSFFRYLIRDGSLWTGKGAVSLAAELFSIDDRLI